MAKFIKCSVEEITYLRGEKIKNKGVVSRLLSGSSNHSLRASDKRWLKMIYGRLALMGRDSIDGIISEVELFGTIWIQVDVPILYEAYVSVGKDSYHGCVLKRFSGKYKKPVYFRPNAIFSMEELSYSELFSPFVENQYISSEDDLPF